MVIIGEGVFCVKQVTLKTLGAANIRNCIPFDVELFEYGADVLGERVQDLILGYKLFSGCQECKFYDRLQAMQDELAVCKGKTTYVMDDAEDEEADSYYRIDVCP